jgi:hypothetical protein
VNIVAAAKSLNERPTPDRVEALRALAAEWSEDIKVWERSEWYYPPQRGASPVRITPRWLALERKGLADLKQWLAAYEERRTALSERRNDAEPEA